MKFLKIIMKLTLVSLIILCIGYIGIYVYAYFQPKLSIDSVNSYYLYDSKNELYPTMTNEWVNIEDISEDLIDATLSIEDKHFYHHIGFDYIRILKALYINIQNKKTLQGASTITQQYAKNLFLDFDKTWNRKLEEALLTIRLEVHYSKNELLEGYLNTINYGGIFGIESASKYYFGKSSKDLTLAEASILAGIPKSPTNYSPIEHYDKAKQRQLVILNSMVKNNYITEEEKNRAYNEKLNFVGSLEQTNLKTLMYYQDAVMSELKNIKDIPSSFLTTGGLKIYTNLDLDAQTTLENKINDNLKENLQIASVIMKPNTGEIIALAGGTDYSKSQFNRVTSAKRQVGSTMKPLLYYAALENGFTASTTFTSTKTTFSFSDNKTYSPQNYGDSYPNKAISMQAALAYSDNIYAVKTHVFLGEETLVNTAKRMGIRTNLTANPSLALGSSEINILEMMTAYSTLANEGYKVEPFLIKKVEDINGNILYEHHIDKENVLNKSITFILNEMMSNCASYDLIDYSYPTCINIAEKLTKKYAIKTGTTETDNLIFGYNKDIIMGVWAGYDNNNKTEDNVGTQVKNIWADTVEEILKDKDAEWYEMPSNVVGVLVNPITGEIANEDGKKKIMYYIKGTEPVAKKLTLDDMIPTIKEETLN